MGRSHHDFLADRQQRAECCFIRPIFSNLKALRVEQLRRPASLLALFGSAAAGLTIIQGPAPWAIAAEPAQLAQTSASPSNFPLLSPGSSGAPVSRLQATLKLLGFYTGPVDGAYSPSTQEAVANFQAAAGIAADGIAGPSTWAMLLPNPEDVPEIAANELPSQQPVGGEVASPEGNEAAAADSEAVPSGPPILRRNAEGPAVAQLQRELQALGHYQGPIDGGFGEQTEKAVIEFQTQAGIAVDGVVGYGTWDALTEALSRLEQ